MTYSWLLFDADGTLFDYDQAEATALEQAFIQVGTAFEPAHLNAYREINTRVWREFEAGRITAERLRLRRFELLFETLGRSLTPAEFSPVYLRHLARASQLIEGAREIVPALCAKYRLALITNGLRDRLRLVTDMHPPSPPAALHYHLEHVFLGPGLQTAETQIVMPDEPVSDHLPLLVRLHWALPLVTQHRGPHHERLC